MIRQPYTHVGIVVPDLDRSLAHMRTGLGTEWCDVLQWDMAIWTPEGVDDITCRFTYSRGPQPRFELLQSVPGTVWEVGSSTEHHVGYWSTDLRGDGAELESKGWRLVATLADEPGTPTGFGYYRHPDGGPVLELVDDALVPRFERWWRGERF